MAEPLISPNQNNLRPADIASSDSNLEGDTGGERIFDITADLNISPVKNEPDALTPPILSPAKPPTTSPPSPIPSPAKPTPQASQPTFQKKSLSQELAQEIGMGAGTKLPPMTEPLIVHPNEPRDPNLKPLRTYENDVAEIMARNKTSVASMAVAETKKVQETARMSPEPAKVVRVSNGSSKKFLTVLISIVLLAVGAGGAYYFYITSPLAPAEPIVQQPQVPGSLILSESSVVVSVDKLTAINLTARIQSEISSGKNPDTIKEIILTKTISGSPARLSSTEVIDFLSIPVPNILLRSLAQPGMLGLYTNKAGETDAFIVVTSNFFQNTFAGMLQWEHIMADDLKLYLFPSNVKGVANIPAGQGTAPATMPTSTSSTGQAVSDSITPYFTLRGRFVDRIVKNKDVREFVSDSGQILFLYSFIDNNKLILTNKEETLGALIERLEKASSIR